MLMLACTVTVEQRAAIVRLYYESGKNAYLTVSKFRREYPAHTTLCRSTVLRLVSKFEEHGTMEDRLKQHCGRKKSVTVQANISILSQCIQRSPHASTWRIHAHTGLDRSSIQKMLKKDLHTHLGSHITWGYITHYLALLNASFPMKI